MDWKIGRLVGGEDFADFPCKFTHLTFYGPPPGNISIEYWYNWPVSQRATRLTANFTGFGYVQAGVYEANPRYLPIQNGLKLGDPGVRVVFGVCYNTSRAPDVLDTLDRFPPTLRGERVLPAGVLDGDPPI